MPAREPRVLIDDGGEPFGGLVIGALPQSAEGASGADDRQIIDAVGSCDFRQLVGHARAAGDARDETLGSLEHSMEHALRAAHFPQHVDVDRALAAGDVVGAVHLSNGAVDGEANQFLVPFAAGEAFIDLRDDPAFGIVAVGIDGRHGSNAPGGRPGAGARMIGRAYAFAALDERPDLAASIEDGPQALEHE